MTIVVFVIIMYVHFHTPASLLPFAFFQLQSPLKLTYSDVVWKETETEHIYTERDQNMWRKYWTRDFSLFCINWDTTCKHDKAKDHITPWITERGVKRGSTQQSSQCWNFFTFRIEGSVGDTFVRWTGVHSNLRLLQLHKVGQHFAWISFLILFVYAFFGGFFVCLISFGVWGRGGGWLSEGCAEISVGMWPRQMELMNGIACSGFCEAWRNKYASLLYLCQVLSSWIEVTGLRFPGAL